MVTPTQVRRRARWAWFAAGVATGQVTLRIVFTVGDWLGGRSPVAHSLQAAAFTVLALALAVCARELRRRESQAYYWTARWQADEREAAAELGRGEGRRFTSPDDAIAWLKDQERP